MDLQFYESDELPRPRAEVRIRRVDVAPYPDGRRVRIDIALVPFAERPNIEVELLRPDGGLAASLAVIESVEHEFAVTLHLRQPEPGPGYCARVVLYYSPALSLREQDPNLPDEVIDTREVPFALPEPEREDDDEDGGDAG
jgi:hypothetical protein